MLTSFFCFFNTYNLHSPYYLTRNLQEALHRAETPKRRNDLMTRDHKIFPDGSDQWINLVRRTSNHLIIVTPYPAIQLAIK